MPPGPSATSDRRADLLCFSHLRWNWVFQRPQHLLTRAARDWRVTIMEEPVFSSSDPHMEVEQPHDGITVVRPCLRHDIAQADLLMQQGALLEQWLAETGRSPEVLWYYTPMALPFSRRLKAPLVVYDCMDELSGFAGASPALRLMERQLLARCHVVFTGGHSLYEAKASLHPNVHAMPSSVDVDHFSRARRAPRERDDHRNIPRPRIGFCGVIDERLDRELVAAIAARRPDWQLVFVGPVTKIAPEDLPHAANIHYLGPRPYAELPEIFAAWDVGMLPFALNDATRYISPTKTPEYLAAGLPVVSTPIRDVERTWGAAGLVSIASDADAFVAAIERAFAEPADLRWPRVDRTLAASSWDVTWQRMRDLLSNAAIRAA